MPDEWIVRVGEKEYGPVDLETLHEWKAEGRLLPSNPVRRVDDTDWSTAAEIPDLFESVPASAPHVGSHSAPRTLGQIFTETFRIYARGFGVFFALALLVAVPSLGFKISLAFVNYREGEVVTRTTQIASALAIVMFALVLVAWPLFVAGLQFATQDLAAGGRIRLGDILRRAVNFWPRVARLSLLVYGSYLFWTVLPLLAILAFAGTPNAISLLLALVALAFQVYMAGRLFINFMF
ncbi:MAG: DUF4339 domain-containing protein, partial [Verrucomicrobiota bacterium]|nr:DUF4339 domain-containing protein [Verrucomicrobiota bacterium]